MVLDDLTRSVFDGLSDNLDVDDPHQMIGVLTNLARNAYASGNVEEGQKYLDLITSANEEAAGLVDKDSLTGIMKRASFEKHFDRAYSDFGRTGRSFAVMIGDVDNFKAVNDNYGHLGGDDVLKEIANRLGHDMRMTDGIYRYAGDEFAGIYAGVDEGQALAVVDKAVRRVSESDIVTRDSRSLAASISAGVYLVGEGDSFDNAVEKADNAAYRAKEAGRNMASL